MRRALCQPAVHFLMHCLHRACWDADAAWRMLVHFQATLSAVLLVISVLRYLQETGIGYEAAIARPFWELFQLPFELGSEPWRAMLDVAERAGEFAVRGCTLADAPHRGLFTITFRYGTKTVFSAMLRAE